MDWTRKGFGNDQLAKIQEIISLEKSGLFDVLAYVANTLKSLALEDRADRAMAVISQNFNPKRQMFLDFVLSRYLAFGVEELDKTKLTQLLKLKLHDSIPDAVADLGRLNQIGTVI